MICVPFYVVGLNFISTRCEKIWTGAFSLDYDLDGLSIVFKDNYTIKCQLMSYLNKND